MKENSNHTRWMKDMISSCFFKSTEQAKMIPEDIVKKMVQFQEGKLGRTFVVYYQKPPAGNEKVDNNLVQSTFYINEEATNKTLCNRAAFFIRTIPDNKEVVWSNYYDTDISFGEISPDSIIGMNKVIYNYLFKQFDNVGTSDDWGSIENEQKREFKKILESFAVNINSTVESLINGVKFEELPKDVVNSLVQDKKELIEENSRDFIQKIEKIYEGWINTLTKEVEDMEKDAPEEKSLDDDDNNRDVGPKKELYKWKCRLQRLIKVTDFTNSKDYKLVNAYLSEQTSKSSQKINELKNHMRQKLVDATTARAEAKDNVKYLSTLEIYFEPLYEGTPDSIIDSLQSMMNSLKLISFTARYYDSTKMTNLFSRISAQMIKNCKNYILDKKEGEYSPHEDPEYLWEKKPSELIPKFQKCQLLFEEYKKKYKEAKENTNSTNKENNFEFGENQLFGQFDQFNKRLTKLIELFSTIKQFQEIKDHKLDSMDEIQYTYSYKLEEFKNNTKSLLKHSKPDFDKKYVSFNLAIGEIEANLHKNINEEFKKINWTEKRLKLLKKYEKILTKSNLKENLRTERLEIFSNYKREIERIQSDFEKNRLNPTLQRNLPAISGKIRWAKQLFNKVFPYISEFKEIQAKDRKDTEISYMTTNTLLYSYINLNEQFFSEFVDMAKTRLTNPLLVYNENSSPKVNLDILILQLIREAKCMLRMNCNIPESAKIILLQEEKYKRYYNELTFMVKEYVRILKRINKSDSENYFKGHIKDLNAKLNPLKTTINWSSMNIESSLHVVFNCLQNFEYSINSFMEILDNRVHKNMISIRNLKLLNIPENPTSLSIQEIIQKQEDYIKTQNIYLESKNKEIEAAILDMIQGIKSYELEPKIQKVEDSVLYKLINDYEDKFYEFLVPTTKNSLISLKERISGEKSEPIFSVTVNLISNQLDLTPKISFIQEAINKIAKSILFAMKGIYSWKRNDSKEVTSFHERIGKNNEIVKMILVLTGSFEANNVQIEEFLQNTFSQYKPLYTDSIEKRIKDFNQKKDKTYLDYEERLKNYEKIHNSIVAINDKENIGVVELNLKNIKEKLLKSCNEWRIAYLRQLLLITRDKGKEIKNQLNKYEEMVNKKPEEIEELQIVVTAIEEIRQKEGTIENQIKPFVSLYNLVKKNLEKESDLERFNFPTQEDFDTKWKNILIKAGENRDNLKENQLEFKRKLYEEAKKLKDEVEKLNNDYKTNGPTQQKGKIEDAYDKLITFRTRVATNKKTWENIKKGEEIFNTTPNQYPDLERIDADLKMLGTLYDLYMRVRTQKDEWKEVIFSELIPKKVEEPEGSKKEGMAKKEEYISVKKDEMENKCAEFSQSLIRVDPKLKGQQEFANLKDEIEELKNFVEACGMLTDPNFEDYHYSDLAEQLHVKELANVKLDGGNFKLKLLFDANIAKESEKLEETKTLAKNQKKVRDNLADIDNVWKSKVFKFQEHNTLKDIQLLDAMETQEIKNVLEDHQAKIASFKSMSRSLTEELKSKVKLKETQFQTISSTIDLWISVQQLWNSLQSFFIGGDIRKELPGATKSFLDSNKTWYKIMMDRAFPTKNVFQLCATNELTPDLIEIEKVLKDCQQKLDYYLEQKRGTFPRFYFVSNSVLLDILSKRSDPTNIKSNLGIIFDAINDIEFDEVDKKTIVKIRQLKNLSNLNDKQEVDMHKHPVKCDGKIEAWLGDLVESMKLSLRELFDMAQKEIQDFFPIKFDENNIGQFRTFIEKYVCQVVIFGIQLFGTKRLEELIVFCSADKNGEANKKQIINGKPHQSDTDFKAILMLLTKMCREDNPSKLARVKLETLIIIHVHNGDIFDYFTKDKEMIRQTVTINDYDWLKQTRVYYYTFKSSQKNIRTCLINITDVAFEYGYEFLGARERMCITPLTDKCYITLAQAMGMMYGGSPAGPAGTGKTETVKDMGRTMGVFVLVTNCAPEHRYKNMAEIFKGLCLSGAWGCFDEFNRIQLDVLSVLATIITAIQDCRKKGAEDFEFPEGANVYKKIALIPTMGYFITMNPGYSGRQELPENLKVLFRGVTMMAPNRESIIRVKLCSYGFENHGPIATKFRKLYELCEAQLSKQTHYDFGLRNILSVLRHGGNEKKKFKDNPDKEENLIFSALRNMNLSKFVPDDIKLFENLIKDVFPQQNTKEEKKYEHLEDCIAKELIARNLDRRPEWVKKIIQTYETYNVRHGFMVVGTTGTGKTTIMEVLTKALTEGSEIFKLHRLNPKAVEDQNLFIEKIIDRYVLGTFTEIWKKCNESKSPYSKQNNWVVCDGPIDSLWIENLNTVLDDNKILTLSNNERIAMADTCRLVMECENVKNASLATVSRCGMIYITETDITHTPLINGWFNRQGKTKDFKAIIEILKERIPQFINSNVENEFIKNYHPVMEISWLIKVKNFLLLLEAVIKSSDKSAFSNLKVFVNKACAFAFAWAFGSIMEEKERRTFHDYMKKSLNFPIPDSTEDKTIFDYTLNNDFEPWITPESKIEDRDLDNFSSLLVPTVDSTRAIYMIDKMNMKSGDSIGEDLPQSPVLILGESGTSKTSTVLIYSKTFNEENKKALKRVNFSSATSPSNFQETIDDELEKSGNDFVPVQDRNLVVFLDDLSMPYVNKWGDQVTLELVRQLLEFNGYYLIKSDENRGEMKKISKLSYIGAMEHPKGGKNDIPNRLKRHFFIFNMTTPSRESVQQIYGKITSLFFNRKKKGSPSFTQVLKDASEKLPKLTYDLFRKMDEKFKPTPIKFHYFYNMRELSRTFQGLFQADKKCLNDAQTKYGIAPETFLFCLWKHEVTRVFCDKLREIPDKKEYENILDSVLNNNFEKDVVEILKQDVYFCDYLRPIEDNVEYGFQYYPKYYENIVTLDKARGVTQKFMDELNQTKEKHVDIVLFDDCLKNIMRITRVIEQDQGSCMIVGVGGSGKQSLARLSSRCEQYTICQPTFQSSPPRDEEFRAAMRGVFETVINDYNPPRGKFFVKHTMLMTDAEFKKDYFLEAVSSFLATGEIANLFGQKADKNNIISIMRTTLSKIDPKLAEIDEAGVWNELISTERKYIHFCLCFSPSSDKFREKFIKFPVLFNNTTIIWLLPWPEEALISVTSGAVQNNEKLELVGKKEQLEQLYKHIANVHIKISEEICSSYYENFKRHVYVTPKSFLCFIQEYMNIYIKKIKSISEKESTINNGLAKLKEADEGISKQNKEIEKQADEANKVKKEADEEETKVSKEAEKAKEISDKVSVIAANCKKNADIIKVESDQVNAELKNAEPALKEAEKSIKNLNKGNLESVTKGANVALTIQFYFECSAIIMGFRLLKISDFGQLGINKNFAINYYKDISYEVEKVYLNGNFNTSFYATIEAYKSKLADNDLTVNDEKLELIKPFLRCKNHEGKNLFDPASAIQIGGAACGYLAAFCSTIQEYVNCVRDVKPKQMKVFIMESKFKQATIELNEKLAEKQAAEDVVTGLTKNLDEVRRKRDELVDNLNKMLKRVNAAKNLLASLQGEKVRWTEQSKQFDQEKKQLLGDSAISSAFIAYAGPFNYTYRKDILLKKLFRDDVEKRMIPFTDGMDVKEFLVDESTKNEWLMSKLPNDELSIQNAILVTTSSRFPLLIDPQSQAKNWLVNMYPGILANKLVFQMAVFCGKNYLNNCRQYMEDDCQVMLEGIENDVDTCLDPVLTKEFLPGKATSKSRKLKIGECEIEFCLNFKLFLLCKLINPHFTPELAAKTTIIDFCVTAIGLEQQLQAIVISKEQKQLEETLKGIVSDIAKNKNSLLKCQADILENLNKPGNLLDNEDIVVVLNNSKMQAEENTKKIKEAEEKKTDINAKREKYLPVATRGSVLYFSIVQMEDISKMYSISLQQFLVLFNYSIENAVKSNNPDKRVNNIIKKLTEHVYKYVVRGLFEKHKTAFILLVCFKILSEEKVNGGPPLLKPSDISFFIKCAAFVQANSLPDCPYNFLISGKSADKKPKEYLNLEALIQRKFNDTHSYFQRLPEKIQTDSKPIETFYKCNTEPEKIIPYNDLYTQNPKLVAFLQLCFVRALREDRTMMVATTMFVPEVLEDKDFLKPYAEELKDLYNITNAKIPILYLLSAGADPSSNIETLARKKERKLYSISMGEGQAEIAMEKVKECKVSGDWVYFQNCHLGLEFMAKLDIMLKDTEDLNWNDEMRIWLSCEPTNDFPIGLLHQSLKVTNEPPKGIKAGMLKTYSTVVSAEKLDIFEYKEWRSLIFTLSFIHSLVIERRKYGALGFCVPYDFNNSDLEASILFVEKQFQRESDLENKKKPEDMINLKTLTNVVSDILYGGRIFDLKDESLFKTIVSFYIENPTFKSYSNFCFYKSGSKNDKNPVEYSIPENIKEIKQYTEHIERFPTVDPPQVFGLHSLADTTFRLKEFNELLDTLQTALPKDNSGGGGESKEEMIKRQIIEFISMLPKEFNEKEYRDTINALSFSGLGSGLDVPLNNVLLQEIQDVQRILLNVKRTLCDVRDALQGTLLMTEVITECIESFGNFKPPKIWMFDANGGEISWLSSSASTWFKGLVDRVSHLRTWLASKSDERPPFYLPGLLKPQGFLAAYRQEYFKLKRSTVRALDLVDLKYEPSEGLNTDPYVELASLSGKGKKDEILIFGLFIEGAIWGKDHKLADPQLDEVRSTINAFPVIRVSGYDTTGGGDKKNEKASSAKDACAYSCPLYKYPKRTDKYIITDIKLTIGGAEQDEKFWQRRGVALLCNSE